MINLKEILKEECDWTVIKVNQGKTENVENKTEEILSPTEVYTSSKELWYFIT